MQERFRRCYEERTCFREDAALGEALAREAGPVLDALQAAFEPPDGPRATHEAFALSTLLARTCALLGATPSAALALAEAQVEALCAVGIAVDAALARSLSVITLEGYCAARDERTAQQLRRAAASAQLAIRLAPQCLAIHLSGDHDEADLSPVLDEIARALLRDDVQACLIDVRRLDLQHDEIARLVAGLCATATSLGARVFMVGASPRLRAQLISWLALSDRLQHVDDYEAAQMLALSAVGREIRSRARWTALRFWQARQASER